MLVLSLLYKDLVLWLTHYERVFAWSIFFPRRYHSNDCKCSTETCKGLIMYSIENEKMKVEPNTQPLQSSKRRSQKGQQRALIWRMHIKTSCYLYVWEKKYKIADTAVQLQVFCKLIKTKKEITSLKRAECLSTLILKSLNSEVLFIGKVESYILVSETTEIKFFFFSTCLCICQYLVFIVVFAGMGLKSISIASFTFHTATVKKKNYFWSRKICL